MHRTEGGPELSVSELGARRPGEFSDSLTAPGRILGEQDEPWVLGSWRSAPPSCAACLLLRPLGSKLIRQQRSLWRKLKERASALEGLVWGCKPEWCVLIDL